MSTLTQEKHLQPIVGYKILRDDRAAFGCPAIGTVVYHGRDCYGCASEDTRREDLEHIACSVNQNGVPFFTIPREDVEPIYG
jgi:hypothetical protein